jgi:hypothetical protein
MYENILLYYENIMISAGAGDRGRRRRRRRKGLNGIASYSILPVISS